MTFTIFSQAFHVSKVNPDTTGTRPAITSDGGSSENEALDQLKTCKPPGPDTVSPKVLKEDAQSYINPRLNYSIFCLEVVSFIRL